MFLRRPLEQYLADSAADTRVVLEDVIIATLPDPHDTHLDWMWDTQLESIVRAFEFAQYLKDRFYFPNPAELSSGWKNDPSTAPSPLRSEPAVILFRKGRPDALGRQPLVLLYIVGETPTGGIFERPFFTALAERDSLLRRSGLGDSSKPDTLRLVAPTFSGSAFSLRLLLESDSIPHPAHVEIVSGTATSLANVETLRLPGRSIHFAATLHSDATMQEVLRDSVLPTLGILPSQVAVLQEFSTQYGRNIQQGEPDSLRPRAPGSSGAPRPVRQAAPDAFVSYPFPANISRLRSEFERHPELRGAERGQLPGLSGQPRVPLDLVDPSRPAEDAPVTSRLTPPAVDLLLDQIARSLTENDIRLVGILATDVRDKLFLAHELRRRMRDVQFFTYGTNLLLLRADWTRAMHGALVLATYPLIPDGAADPTAPVRSLRFSFGSDAALGTFNAALMQLGLADSLQEYRSPGDSARRSFISGEPVPVTTPPIWIVTAGRGAFLPVTVFRSASVGTCYLALAPGCESDYPAVAAASASAPASGCYQRAAADHTHLEGHRRTRLDTFTIVTVLALLTFAAVATLVLGPDLWRTVWPQVLERLGITPKRRSRPSIEVSPREQEQLRRSTLALQEQFFALLLLAAILATLGPMTAFIELRRSLVPDEAGRQALFWVLLACTVGMLVLLSAAGMLVARLVRRADVLRQVVRNIGTLRGSVKASWWLEVTGRLLVNVAALVLAGIAVSYAWEIARHSDTCVVAGGQLVERLRRLDSLVSPLLVVLVAGAGFTAWALWHRTRVRRLRDKITFEHMLSRWMSPPDTTVADDPWRPALRQIAIGSMQVRDRLMLLLPQRWAPLVAILIVAPLLWLVPQLAHTLETLAVGVRKHSAFDLLLMGSLIATFMSTAWATYRLIAVWLTTQHLLEHMAELPVSDALARLGPEVGGMDLLAPGASERSDLRVATMLPARTRVQLLLTRLVTSGAPATPGEATSSEAIAAANLYLKPSGESAIPDDELGTDEADQLGRLANLLRVQWYDRLRAELRPSWKAGAAPAWQQAAEDYLALMILEYIAWVMRHLRHLTYFLLASLVLTTILLSTYPFYPQHLFKFAFLGLVLMASGTMLYVLFKQNRDAVLSWIGKTKPGRVTWDLGFVLKLFTAGAIPLLTLLSSEFPQLRDALLSWTRPFLDRMAQ